MSYVNIVQFSITVRNSYLLIRMKKRQRQMKMARAVSNN